MPNLRTIMIGPHRMKYCQFSYTLYLQQESSNRFWMNSVPYVVSRNDFFFPFQFQATVIMAPQSPCTLADICRKTPFVWLNNLNHLQVHRLLSKKLPFSYLINVHQLQPVSAKPPNSLSPHSHINHYLHKGRCFAKRTNSLLISMANTMPLHLINLAAEKKLSLCHHCCFPRKIWPISPPSSAGHSHSAGRCNGAIFLAFSNTTQMAVVKPSSVTRVKKEKLKIRIFMEKMIRNVGSENGYMPFVWMTPLGSDLAARVFTAWRRWSLITCQWWWTLYNPLKNGGPLKCFIWERGHGEPGRHQFIMRACLIIASR